MTKESSSGLMQKREREIAFKPGAEGYAYLIKLRGSAHTHIKGDLPPDHGTYEAAAAKSNS